VGDQPQHPHWLVVTAAVLTAPAAPAWADSGSGSAALEEVVVTAQKRAEELSAVPMPVTALTATMIEREDLGAFVDLVRAVPALTIKTARNLQSSSVSLRGVGTFAFSVGLEPSVAVIVDDVAVTQQAQAFDVLDDIERIEVLEGPQSTLFGKNASAGVINIVTRDPTPTITSALTQSYAQFCDSRTDGMISGPLGERAGYRVSGYYQSSGGYIVDLTNGLKLNNSDDRGIRGKLRFALFDWLEVMLIGDHDQNSGRGSARTYGSLPGTALLFGVIPVSGFAQGITPGPSNYRVRLDSIPQINSNQTTVSMRARLDLGRQELLSISSYQQWNYFNNQDLDGSDADVLGAVTGGAAHGGLSQSGPTALRQYTTELRLDSMPGQSLNYVSGLYYSDVRTTRTTIAGPILMVGGFAAAIDSKSSAVFAQSSYRLGASSKLTAGLRLSHQQSDMTLTDLVPAVPVSYHGNEAESKVTGKLSWQRNFAAGSMFFASVATGYKGAGFDASQPVTMAKATTPVRAETSTSYDTGVKTLLLGDRLRVDATVFLTDYRDFQAQSAIFNPATLQLDPIVTNVGGLRTQGVEAAVQWQATPAWWIAASAADIDATIRSFANAPCYPRQSSAQGCVYLGLGPSTNTVQDLRGHSLYNSPRVKFSINSSYEWHTSWRRAIPFVDVNYAWQSKVNFDLFGDPAQVQGAYGLFNASLGVKDTAAGGFAFSASIFVRNLFNKSYASTIDDATTNFAGVPPASVTLQVLPRDSQRLLGIRIGARF